MASCLNARWMTPSAAEAASRRPSRSSRSPSRASAPKAFRAVGRSLRCRPRLSCSALGVLCEPPKAAHVAIAEALRLPGRIDAADHTELFGFQLVPYASVYLGAEGMLGGEAADRVAGFWRALRLTPPPEPDHLAALLGLYATIGEAERGERDRARQALWRQARRALLWEHLLTWAVTYARAVIGSAPPFHAAWAQLLERTLLAEAADLEPPTTPGQRSPGWQTRRPGGRRGTGGLKRCSARSGVIGGSGPRQRGRCCSSWNGRPRR